MRISVAIASYNGEKYIEEQIRSIINQSYPVNEIIVSDDGSSDKTVEILNRIKDKRIIVIQNNGRKGYCGNFENALKKCTGDYIFLADQDDLWMQNKVQSFIDFIEKYPSASCIFSDGILIDENDNQLLGEMNHTIHESSEMLWLDRNKYLERAVSQPLANGMAICISKKLLESALPFPDIKGSHDQWLIFCSLCLDTCYYLNKKLVKYRLHGNNTAGNPVYKGKPSIRLKKIYARIKNGRLKTSDLIELGTAMIRHLENYHLENTNAYLTAKRIIEIGAKEQEAFNSSRTVGAYKLIKLFRTDIRYRKSGTGNFIYKLVGILLGR